MKIELKPSNGKPQNFCIEIEPSNGKSNRKSNEIIDELNTLLLEISTNTNALNSSLDSLGKSTPSLSERFMKNASELEVSRERDPIKLHDTSE